MLTTKENVQLFNYVQRISLDCGFGDLGYCTVGGGADSAYFSELGIPVVCALGPKGGMNHSEKEFVMVESLAERTKLLAACIMKYNF